VVTVGYTGMFDTPDLGAMFTGVRDANDTGQMVVDAFQTVEEAGMTQKAFTNAKTSHEGLGKCAHGRSSGRRSLRTGASLYP
jgi:hypothetical protein